LVKALDNGAVPDYAESLFEKSRRAAVFPARATEFFGDEFKISLWTFLSGKENA
jgi:hypothetical protein